MAKASSKAKKKCQSKRLPVTAVTGNNVTRLLPTKGLPVMALTGGNITRLLHNSYF